MNFNTNIPPINKPQAPCINNFSEGTVISGKFGVKHVTGSSLVSQDRGKQFWEKHTGFDFKQFDCSIMGCMKMATDGAHVYIKGIDISDICFIIPMCRAHNLDRSFNHISSDDDRWKETKYETRAVCCSLDRRFYVAGPHPIDRKELKFDEREYLTSKNMDVMSYLEDIRNSVWKFDVAITYHTRQGKENCPFVADTDLASDYELWRRWKNISGEINPIDFKRKIKELFPGSHAREKRTNNYGIEMNAYGFFIHNLGIPLPQNTQGVVVPQIE